MASEQPVGSSTDPLLGLLLGGRYRIVAPLASGSMGVVYEGFQEGLGRRVAIKCLHPHLASSEDFIALFMIEARVASRLSHPNVVRIYDFGTEPTPNGTLIYLVMEFCAGVQLGELLANGVQIPLSRVAGIMSQVLAALAEAHAYGIVHRDVKPENVILEPRPRGGEVAKLIDFGIAEAKVEGKRGPVGIAGTPYYLSPEVIRGEEVDHQADLYAAGSMLFELITGQVLFEGDDIPSILEQQLSAPRPDPRVVAPGRHISDELAAVCLRSVALSVKDRFVDVDAFADALASAIVAPPSRPPSQAPVVRAPLKGAPESRRSVSPAGRYSSKPSEDRDSGETVRAGESSAFWVLQELEREASTAMTRRQWKVAVVRLRAGLEVATAEIAAGQTELGGAAFSSFGRRLGEALRRDGLFQEGLDALKGALVHSPDGELPRALLLEELGLNAAALGREGDAIGAWLDAAEVARTCGNAAVERRLLRRLEGG